MPFREAAPPAAVRLIRYGPFPARWGRGAFSALRLLSGGVVGIGIGGELRVECRRDPGAEATCVRTEDRPLLGKSERRFRGSDVAEVRSAYRPGSRRGSSGHYEVLLIDPRGAETSAGTRSGEADAELLRDRLDRFLRDSSGTDVRVVTRAGPWSSGLALVLPLVAVALLASAFANAGRIRIEVDRAHDSLRVTRTLFGVPLRGTDHRLGDFRGVRVEEGPIVDRLRPARTAPAWGWRVALVRPGGNGVALDDSFRGRRMVHDRCAAELRAELGFSREGELPLEPQAAPRSEGLRLLILLFAGAAVIAVGGNAILTEWANRTQGWLELRASSRCRFGGAEILPGGFTRMSLDPGRYEVEVYNPALPGKWERQSFEIRIGEVTKVSCSQLTR